MVGTRYSTRMLESLTLTVGSISSPIMRAMIIGGGSIDVDGPRRGALPKSSSSPLRCSDALPTLVATSDGRFTWATSTPSKPRDNLPKRSLTSASMSTLLTSTSDRMPGRSSSGRYSATDESLASSVPRVARLDKAPWSDSLTLTVATVSRRTEP